MSQNDNQTAANDIEDFATARLRVCSDMKADAGLYQCYHANISCVIHDEIGATWDRSNRLATALMKKLFDADEPTTATGEVFGEDPPEAAKTSAADGK